MRLRNVKHAKELIENNPNIIIEEPKQYKGKWNGVFGNNNPIEVEIGCGKGKFIVEHARKNPNINYIGIDKFDSVIVRAIEKLLDEPLKNIRLIRVDAENIEEIFANKEICKIYLNFSDPWPKRRHAKKRLTSSRFLKRYSNILVYNGYIEFKSDNYSLFEFSMMSFNSSSNYKVENIIIDLYRNLPETNVQTEFEMKFVNRGNRIFYQKVKFIGDKYEEIL
ncbi:MAG: tRNA (guanosine(46)-N7)-methyltransferase TrmB [Tenericutes bacterium]|nr:tRNA (guanosine(46)-N7)-methyltransferase TrmB [Mycoplasmatota bacterium]